MFSLYIGSPGSHKTSLAIYEKLLPAFQSGRPILANLRCDFSTRAEFAAVLISVGVDPGKGQFSTSPFEITDTVAGGEQPAAYFIKKVAESGATGVYANSFILLDEIGVIFDPTKRLPNELVQFFQMHRHYGVDIVGTTVSNKSVHPALTGDLIEESYRLKKTYTGGYSGKIKLGVFPGMPSAFRYADVLKYIKPPPEYVYKLYNSHVGSNIIEQSSRFSVFNLWHVFIGASILALIVFGYLAFKTVNSPEALSVKTPEKINTKNNVQSKPVTPNPAISKPVESNFFDAFRSFVQLAKLNNFVPYVHYENGTPQLVFYNFSDNSVFGGFTDIRKLALKSHLLKIFEVDSDGCVFSFPQFNFVTVGCAGKWLSFDKLISGDLVVAHSVNYRPKRDNFSVSQVPGAPISLISGNSNKSALGFDYSKFGDKGAYIN